MRAYAKIRTDQEADDVLFAMKNYLSFDRDLPIMRKTKPDGSIILYQDAPMKCELCGHKGDDVIYHHFYNRKHKSLVDDNYNRIPLCAECHTNNNRSAHLSPKWFRMRIAELRGQDWLQELRRRKNDLFRLP